MCIYVCVCIYLCVCISMCVCNEYMHNVPTMRPGFDFSMQDRWGVPETHTMG